MLITGANQRVFGDRGDEQLCVRYGRLCTHTASNRLTLFSKGMALDISRISSSFLYLEPTFKQQKVIRHRKISRLIGLACEAKLIANPNNSSNNQIIPRYSTPHNMYTPSSQPCQEGSVIEMMAWQRIHDPP